MIELKDNYQDDVLDSEKNQLRKYNMIHNDDGTVSFVDATVYSQNGDNFGAKDVNDIVARIGEVSKAENIAYDGDKSVQGAIDELKGTIGYTSPNRLPYPYYETSKTLDGIEWIDNGNGTVKANGTSSNVARFEMSSRTEKPISLKRGTYLLYGCPSGFPENVYIWVVRTGSDGNIEYLAIDYGDGATFTLDEDCDSIGVQIRINNGVTVENLIFEPMIVPASLGKIPFEPYVADVQTQLNNVGRIVVDEYLSVSISAGAEAVVKSYSGLDVGVYMATFTAVGTSNSMMSAHIYLNNANIQGSRCFSNSSTASAQTNVATIFRITSARDVIHFKAISSAELTNREGQSIKIVRIA